MLHNMQSIWNMISTYRCFQKLCLEVGLGQEKKNDVWFSPRFALKVLFPPGKESSEKRRRDILWGELRKEGEGFSPWFEAKLPFQSRLLPRSLARSTPTFSLQKKPPALKFETFLVGDERRGKERREHRSYGVFELMKAWKSYKILRKPILKSTSKNFWFEDQQCKKKQGAFCALLSNFL